MPKGFVHNAKLALACALKGCSRVLVCIAIVILQALHLRLWSCTMPELLVW